MDGFTELGGTLLTANFGTVLGHVNRVRVSGIPGTFECESDVTVEPGMTYALGVAGYALVVQVEDCWPDATKRRHANGRVIRQLSDIPGTSRPHEEGCPLRGWREVPGRPTGRPAPECECIDGMTASVRG